jgi:hypothetical protein
MLRIVPFTWPINTRMIHVCLYLLMHIMYVFLTVTLYNGFHLPNILIIHLANVNFQGFKTPFYDLGTKI